MVTKIAKGIFAVGGLLLMVAGILPALQGQPLNTRSLTFATVFLLLALGLRPRRPPASPSGPDA